MDILLTYLMILEVGEDLQNTVTDIGRMSEWPTPEIVRKNLEDEYAFKRNTLPVKAKLTARGRESQSFKGFQANMTLINKKRQGGRLSLSNKNKIRGIIVNQKDLLSRAMYAAQIISNQKNRRYAFWKNLKKLHKNGKISIKRKSRRTKQRRTRVNSMVYIIPASALSEPTIIYRIY
jgi:hypothetical protein